MKLMCNILLLFVSVISFSQIDLAVQRGHSDQIIRLEFSPNNKYLVSMAANHEFVIWDLNREKSINTFTISKIERVEGMKFSADESALRIKTKRTTYAYNITHATLKEVQTTDTNYRNPSYFFDAETNTELEIQKGYLRKKRKEKKFSDYKLVVREVEASFLAFDVNPKIDRLIGVAENQRIYVYTYSKGRKLDVLDAHISRINDVCISDDGKYFATAGMDRSILIWNMDTRQINTRLSSRIFQKKTANFDATGNTLFIGDELGYIYEVNLNAAFPSVKAFRPNYHPVNRIVRVEDDYFVASSNNYVYETKNLEEKKGGKKYAYRDFSFIEFPSLALQNWFNVYQIPFGEVKEMALSPDHNHIIYTGNSEYPCITLANRETGKKRRFYGKGNDNNWKGVDFISNQSFLSYYDSTDVIYNWKFEEKEAYFKTDTLPFIIQDIAVLDENQIWINARYEGQYIYNLTTRNPLKISDRKCKRVMKRGNYVVLISRSNTIIFYDLKQQKEIGSFVGHSELVTDVNIHPSKPLFVSSSDDGTVKLWELNKQQLIVTIIPFKNNEFVFVTNDNYYLITKGGLNEIGFKVKGEYFYPEQFDLKYNRPDIVLTRLGYSSPDLIKAYKKAYDKRLKKMNFNENQLNGAFHLPTSQIVNAVNLPKKTTDRSVQLKVLLKDDLYKLDRVNIWVNDVAIYGINGLSIKDKDVHQFEETLTVNLSQGKNKIEVNVLNQNGAESYRSVVEIEANYEESPNLFIATVGISKHQQKKYDLEYADKDARDIANTFKQNEFFASVKALTLTNEEVVKDNLHKLREFLAQAKINDVVILTIAGHGVLNTDFDYFFATHNLDFDNPAVNGIPYEAIEQLLDGIPALRKLLFIDTCHSGELDKDDVEEKKEIDSEKGDIQFRNAGVLAQLKENPLGLQNTNELMRSLFTDLRRGTGATVISSSGGTELSIEGNKYENGLFTYCLLSGLTSGDADLNKDGAIFVSEIQRYVQEEVKQLSGGLQTPTSRLQNNELDYQIWSCK